MARPRESPFKTSVGQFYGILGTRAYIRAKLELVRALSAVDTHTATVAALNEALDSLRLCRNDNLGIRGVIPALMLMLGKYQEAYEFIKWWSTCDVDDDNPYDWQDMSSPYLDIHGANMYESVKPFEEEVVVFPLAALTYLKMKLSTAVEDAFLALDVVQEKSLPMPAALAIQSLLMPTYDGKIKTKTELKALRKVLEKQQKKLFKSTLRFNEHYWKSLADPQPFLDMSKPQYSSPGSREEIKLWALQNQYLWREGLDYVEYQTITFPYVMYHLPQGGPRPT